MNKFRYRFSKLTYWLIIAGIALSVVGFGLNLFVCIKNGISSAVDPVYPIIQYTLMFAVTIALFAILLSILISSYYLVDKEQIVTSFGFIKSKYKIKDIETIELDRNTNKLSVYFSNDTFVVIVVKEEWYSQFVQAILDINPKIEYSIKSKENTPDNKEDKK